MARNAHHIPGAAAAAHTDAPLDSPLRRSLKIKVGRPLSAVRGSLLPPALYSQHEAAAESVLSEKDAMVGTSASKVSNCSPLRLFGPPASKEERVRNVKTARRETSSVPDQV